MTKQLKTFETARHMAQDLHRKINANIANITATTAADLKSVTEDTHKLAESLKADATTQTEELNAYLRGAASKLLAAEMQVKESAAAGKDRLKQANLALLEGAHAATQIVSHAIALLRGKVVVSASATMKVAS